MQNSRVRLITTEWNNFISSILLYLLLPIVPIAAAFFGNGSLLRDADLAIFSAFYCISIGLSSRASILFSSGILLALFFTAMAYYTTVVNQGSSRVEIVILVIDVGVFLMHVTERYIRHVLNAELFFDFS